jgi:hypothetical protein
MSFGLDMEFVFIFSSNNVSTFLKDTHQGSGQKLSSRFLFSLVERICYFKYLQDLMISCWEGRNIVLTLKNKHE